MNRDVCAVVGGQFGSEGKGAVVARIAGEYRHHVRTGAANAGHTFYVPSLDGPDSLWKFVTQQLPVGGFTYEEAEIYIGPGALISPEVIQKEIVGLNRHCDRMRWNPKRVYVDYRAQVVTPEHVQREHDSGLAGRIGSTSAVAREGIGAAQAARVMREVECVTAEMCRWPNQVEIADVPLRLASGEGGVLLEGTQGYGLSLTTGRHPYVTSRNTTAAGLCADAGVAPTRLGRVIVVMRTFPIRVAGSSGPFAFGSQEIDWERLGIDPATELTTVTKKVRRVATFSLLQMTEAIQVNGGTEVALMFADYLDPDVKGLTGLGNQARIAGSLRLKRLVDEIEVFAPVTILGTGPHTMIDRSRTQMMKCLKEDINRIYEENREL